MSRMDSSGRVPFALVAVLLLMSAGLSALYAAKLAREQAEREVYDLRLEALARVADATHAEVEGQAQQVALRAVRDGTEGGVNATRIASSFRDGFRDYVASHFPRIVRSITVSIPDHQATVSLVPRRTMDLVPGNETRWEDINGTAAEVPDLTEMDAVAEVDVLAYPAIFGHVNYTLSLDGTVLRRTADLRAILPVPLPFIAAKAEEAARSGITDVGDIGRITKAILANVAQFRTLGGYASPVRPGTTTRDVLRPEDVTLAVNLALLLEEVRLFRSFDREASVAVDGLRGVLPAFADATPPIAERTLAHLLDAYAANGTLDAVDLFAMYTGLDAEGLSFAGIFAQAVAALADQLTLKMLDYLGLMPVVDFFKQALDWAGDVTDGFVRWLFDLPSEQVAYMHGFVGAVFRDGAVDTGFFGPSAVGLPARTYEIPNGSNPIRIDVPSHDHAVPFPPRDLLARDMDSYWEWDFQHSFSASVRSVGGSLRSLVDDFCAAIARDAVLAGLLPGSALGPIDPKDGQPFLAALSARVERAVDDAIAWARSDPGAVATMMGTLYDSVREAARGVVLRLGAGYDVIVDRDGSVGRANVSLADHEYALAGADPDFRTLTEAQRASLYAAIRADVAASGWSAAAYDARKQVDTARWLGAVEASTGQSFRDGLALVVTGSAGWLVLAREMLVGMLHDIRETREAAMLTASTPVTLEPFRLWDPADPTRSAVERFRVRNTVLRITPGEPSGAPPIGELRVGIVDPGSVPATDASPNVHYTDPWALSRRPFETVWSVRVIGLARLRVETFDRPLLGPGGPEPVAVEKLLRLDFSFSVPVASGWALAGVRYVSSDTFLADAWELVQAGLALVWSVVEPFVRGVLDLLRRVVEFLLRLVEPLLRLAERIVKEIVRVVRLAVDLVQTAIRAIANAIGESLDGFVESLPPDTAIALSFGGARIDLVLNRPDGADVEARMAAGALAVTFTSLDLVEAGRPRPGELRWDVFVRWSVVHEPFRLTALLDPSAVVQDHAFEAQASWTDSWSLEMEGPELATYEVVGATYDATVVLLGAEIDVEFGIRALFAAGLPSLLEAALGRSRDEALADAGMPTSWEWFGRFAEAFVRRAVENTVGMLEQSVSVQVYVTVRTKAVSTTGAGFTLMFLVEGRAVRAFLAWLVGNLYAFFRGVPNPFAADYGTLPRDVTERLWIRAQGYAVVETPPWLKYLHVPVGVSVTVGAYVQANVAAVGEVLGLEWGAWRVDFGAFLTLDATYKVQDWFAAGRIDDVALLHASLHSY